MRVRATVADTPQLGWWLLGIVDGVEVVGPPLLREWFSETTAGMAARYVTRKAAPEPTIPIAAA